MRSKGGKQMQKTQPASEQLKKFRGAAQRKTEHTHAHATEQRQTGEKRFLNMKPDQVQRREDRVRKRKYRATEQQRKQKKKNIKRRQQVLLQSTRKQNKRQRNRDHAAVDTRTTAHASRLKG